MKFDVKDYASHQTLVHTVGSAVQDRGLDVVIHNAGIYNKVSLESGGPELVMENVEVNAVAPFFLTRALLPLLRQSAKCQSGGSKTVVANITSQMGSITDNTSGGHYAYRTSKVSAFSQMLAQFLSDAIDLMNTKGGDEHDIQKFVR